MRVVNYRNFSYQDSSKFTHLELIALPNMKEGFQFICDYRMMKYIKDEISSDNYVVLASSPPCLIKKYIYIFVLFPIL